MKSNSSISNPLTVTSFDLAYEDNLQDTDLTYLKL